jgi:hypothetical protein
VRLGENEKETSRARRNKIGKKQTTMMLTVGSIPEACVFSRPAPTARLPCRAHPRRSALARRSRVRCGGSCGAGLYNIFSFGSCGQRHLILTPLLQLRPDHVVVAVATRVLWGCRERKAFFLPLQPYQVVRLAAFLAPLPRRLLCIIPLLLLLPSPAVGRVGPKRERIRAIGAHLHLRLLSP